MKRGEVWWCEQPHDVHPALIISRDEDIERMTEVCRILARATGC
jgi:mRNA-degrading endonuclease toxin of MazEF toxin-antitoxin module